MSIFQEVSPSEAEYVFHEDPGHGWLAVPVKEVVALGIQVTPFSYVGNDRNTRRKVVYLEEDCDLSAFLRAREAAGKPVRYCVARSAHDSFIRDLPHYRAA